MQCTSHSSKGVTTKKVLSRRRSLGIATGATDDNGFPSFDDYLQDDEGNTMESDKHYDNVQEALPLKLSAQLRATSSQTQETTFAGKGYML